MSHSSAPFALVVVSYKIYFETNSTFWTIKIRSWIRNRQLQDFLAKNFILKDRPVLPFEVQSLNLKVFDFGTLRPAVSRL